tara:strand:- start:498 stop:2381 length:1884 start_codon:yes stop_codon:yes gene_type:complete
MFNPFFRQQIQEPGMDVRTTPKPKAFVDTSDQTNLQLEILENHNEALNAMLDMAVTYKKAEDQVKDVERNLDLKELRATINADSISILKGYTDNSVVMAGETKIKEGPEIGSWHKYSTVGKDKKTAKTLLLQKYKQDKRFDWSDEKFSRQAKAEIDVSIDSNYKSVDDLLRTRLKQRTLTEIKKQGIQASDAIIQGDYTKTIELDNTIESHINSGNISIPDAQKFKQEWRRNVFSAIAVNLNSNQMNSNGNKGRKEYELFYKDSLEIKAGKKPLTAKLTKAKFEKTKQSKEYTYEEYESEYKNAQASEAFIKGMPIRDIININAGVKGVHSINLDTQKTTLGLLFNETPMASLNDFGLQLKHEYGEDGKITRVSVVPADGVETDKSPDYIRKVLIEKNLPLINSEGVLKQAESFAKDHKSRLASDEKALDFSKNRPAFNADIEHYFGEWNSNFKMLLAGQTVEQIASMEPALPWNDPPPESSGNISEGDWAKQHPAIQGMVQTLSEADSVLHDMAIFVSDINKGDGSVKKENNEFGTGTNARLLDLKKRIGNIHISEDYLGRFGAREVLYRFLGPIETKVDAFNGINGNKGSGLNGIDLHGGDNFQNDNGTLNIENMSNTIMSTNGG